MFALIAVIALLSLSILTSTERTMIDFECTNVLRAIVRIVVAHNLMAEREALPNSKVKKKKIELNCLQIEKVWKRH